MTLISTLNHAVCELDVFSINWMKGRGYIALSKIISRRGYSMGALVYIVNIRWPLLDRF